MSFPTKIKLKGLYRDNQTRHWNYAWLNGKILAPEASLQVRNHSPDGFDWGYGGSGAAQLALAICLELYGPVLARKVYQEFKRYHIAGLPQGQDFELELHLGSFNREVLAAYKSYQVTLILFKGDEESDTPLQEERLQLTIPAKDKAAAIIAAEQHYWRTILPNQEVRDTLYTEIGAVEEVQDTPAR